MLTSAKDRQKTIISFIFEFRNQERLEMSLSREWIFKTLESLGLRRLDAEVYVYLAQSDPQEARDIAEALETYRW